MTEAEWLTSDNPAVMLATLIRFYKGMRTSVVTAPDLPDYVVSDRKLRLFTVASLRYMITTADHPPPTVHQLAAISELERFADDGNEDGLFEVWQDANLPRPGIALATRAACRMHAQMVTEHSAADVKRYECGLLRDVIGNSWRSVTLPTCSRCDGDGKAHGSDRPFEWSGPGSYPGPCPVCGGCGWDAPYRTPAVLSLAQAAYSDRPQDGTLDPLTLLALADALEEAGCENEAILRHLRGEEWCPAETWRGRDSWRGNGDWIPLRGPHVRGCFVIDAILGKE